MANLANFKVMLSQRAEAKHGLPCVVLNNNTNLGQAMSRVVTLDSRKPDETDGQLAGRYVDEICESLADESNKEAVELFDATIAAFTDKFKASWSILEGVREEAKELAQEISKLVRDLMTKNEYIQKNERLSGAPSVDFPTFGWNGPKAIGASSFIIETVNGLVTADGAEVRKECDQNLFNLVCSDIGRHVKIKLVEFDADALTAALEVAKEVCGDLSAEAVTEVFNYLLGRDDAERITSVLANTREGTNRNTFDVIKTLDEFILKAYPVADAVVTDQIVFPEDKKEDVKANANAIVTLCNIAAYYELMLETSIFKESLVLNGGILNGDTKDQFLSDGGTLEMVANYLRYMYVEDFTKIPMLGIKGKEIMEKATVMKEKVDAERQKIERRLALEMTSIRVMAFDIVMREYLIKKITRDTPDISLADRSSKMSSLFAAVAEPVSVAVRQFNICFVDAAIAVIIKLNHAGTFVEHLQKRLGAAYLARVEANPTITAVDIKMTDLTVIAKLISEWVADQLFVKANCVTPVAPAAALPGGAEPSQDNNG